MKTKAEVWVTITMRREAWNDVLTTVDRATVRSTNLEEFTKLVREAEPPRGE